MPDPNRTSSAKTAYDATAWMAITIEVVAVLAAVAFALLQAR